MKFFVIGDPAPQPRPRAFVRGKGEGAHASIYNPDSADGWKSSVRHYAEPQRQSKPMRGPLAVSLEFFMRRPKSHVKADGTKRPSAPNHHTGRPDLDNLAKAVLDALVDGGHLDDDSHVTLLTLTKQWAGIEAPVGCRIMIQRMS